MKLAKGTPSWVAAAVAAALLAVVLAFVGHPVWWVAAGALLALAALLLNFFRDPERPIADGVCSPADGVVTAVLREGGRLRINVFMNPLDVHVNRAPLDGTVASVTHVPGGFVPAFKKESERNERVVVEYDTPIGRVTTVQIAGTVARRIVPYVRPGDVLRKGDRIGIIRLGSRVDLYLPEGCEPRVRGGQRVKAGATSMASLPTEAAR